MRTFVYVYIMHAERNSLKLYIQDWKITFYLYLAKPIFYM